MPETCFGCGKNYSDSAIGNHRVKCANLKELSVLGVRKRAVIMKAKSSKLPRKSVSQDIPQERATIRQASNEFGGAAGPEFVEGSSREVPPTPPPAEPLEPPAPPSPPPLADFLPSSTSGLPAHILAQATVTLLARGAESANAPVSPPASPQTTPMDRTASPSPPAVPEAHGTTPNHFGVYRRYFTVPQREPDDEASLLQLCDDTLPVPHKPRPAGASVRGFGRAVVQRVRSAPQQKPGSAKPDRGNWFFPFLNPSSFLLMEWAHTGSNMKSNAEVQRLVDEVILAKEFNCDDLRGFKIARETARLDALDVANDSLQTVDGWRRVSISLSVPKERTKYASEADAPQFVIDNVYVR
ncbi:hypothetical protein EVJ58_g11182, partial [Rhodofomes roseus]